MLIILMSCLPDSGEAGVLPGNSVGAPPPPPESEDPDDTPPTPEPSAIFSFYDEKFPEYIPEVAGSQKFAELIDELTKGDWKIDVFSELYSDTDSDSIGISFVGLGFLDFARVNAEEFASSKTPSKLFVFELCRFNDSVIVINVNLWNSMSPEEQSIIMQCALEVAFDFSGV